MSIDEAVAAATTPSSGRSPRGSRSLDDSEGAFAVNLDMTPRRSAAPENLTPIKEGWLLRKGFKLKRWKERYYVLTEAKLFYFKGKEDTSPRGIIPLGDCSVESVDATKHNKKFCFELESHGPPRLIYCLVALSETEKESWLMLLRRAILNARSIQTQHLIRSERRTKKDKERSKGRRKFVQARMSFGSRSADASQPNPIDALSPSPRVSPRTSRSLSSYDSTPFSPSVDSGGVGAGKGDGAFSAAGSSKFAGAETSNGGSIHNAGSPIECAKPDTSSFRPAPPISGLHDEAASQHTYDQSAYFALPDVDEPSKTPAASDGGGQFSPYRSWLDESAESKSNRRLDLHPAYKSRQRELNERCFCCNIM